MNKEQHKRLTFEQLVARKLQRDDDRLKIKEIYIPSMNGTLLFKRISDQKILSLSEELDAGNKAMELYKRIIYSCCEAFQDTKLHEQCGVADPYDIVHCILSLKEITDIGGQLESFLDLKDAEENVKEEIKN